MSEVEQFPPQDLPPSIPIDDTEGMDMMAERIRQIAAWLGGGWIDDLIDSALEWVEDGIETLERILGQIIDIFNGIVVTPINNLIQGVKDWFFGLMGWRDSTDTSVAQNHNNITNATTQIRSLDSDLGVVDDKVERVKVDVNDRAKYIDVPNNLPMWQSLNPLEDVTFPRILLDSAPKYVRDRTMDGPNAALGTHYHGLEKSDAPFHTTTKDVLHLGFIRAPRARVYNRVGFIVDAVTSPCPLYVAVYRVTDAGLEIEWTSSNISGLIGQNKSEVRLDLTENGEPLNISVGGGEYLAVGILQTGSGSVRRLASVAMDPIAVPSAWAIFPSKINGTFVTSTVPNGLTMQQTSFEFDSVMWMCLGQTIDDGPPDFLRYTDSFDRPNSTSLGRNWTVRTDSGGGIGISGGAAAVSGGQDGIRTGLWTYPLNYDDQTVSAEIGSPASSSMSYLLLRANASFTRGVAVQLIKDEIRLLRLTGINQYELIPGTITAVSLRAGDNVELRARGWTYTVLVNGNPVRTWQDSGTTKLTPRGSEYRFVGLGVFRVLWTNSTVFQSWRASDIPLPPAIVLGMNKIADTPGSASQSVALVTDWVPIPGTRSEVTATHELVIPADGVIQAVEGVVWAASQTKVIQAMVYGYRAGGTSGPPVWQVLSPLSAGAAGAVNASADIRVYAGDLLRVVVAYGEAGAAADRTILGDPTGSKTHLVVAFQPDEELPPVVDDPPA
ncbi:hypothetical protein GS907_24690 [Rhodococcus hoagii]|nr:hypothetical protein [Prescottella equi]